VTPYTTSILKDCQPHKDLLGIRDSFTRKAREVEIYLKDLIADTRQPSAGGCRSI
jgi:hypothetical protein